MIQLIAYYLIPALFIFLGLAIVALVCNAVWRLLLSICFPEKYKLLLEKEAIRKQQRGEAGRGMPDWMGWIIASIFTLFGIWITANTVQLGRRIIAARSDWKPAVCTITDKNIGRVRSTGRNSSTFYTPEVKYSYAEDGKNYAGTKLDFAENIYLTETQVDLVLLSYPRGRATGCYVNPLNPSEAVLDLGFSQIFSFNRIAPLATGLGLGILLFYLSWRWRRRSLSPT